MRINIKKTGKFTYEIPIDNDPRMKVPGLIFGNEEIEKMGDDQVIGQVVNVSMIAGIVKASIAMPDFNLGYGFPIGGVAAMRADDGSVSPGGVGYDINCGVSLMATPLKHQDVSKSMEEITDQIYRTVPVGMERSRRNVKTGFINSVLTHGLNFAREEGEATATDMERTENNGMLPVSDPPEISEMALKRGQAYLGTLGSGNHFLEVQKVAEIYERDIASSFLLNETGQITVMIHSGSRGLGHQVATDYINDIRKNSDRIPHPKDPQLDSVPIQSNYGQRYLTSMAAASNYGFVNRQLMVSSVRQVFLFRFRKFEVEDFPLVYSISHNTALEESHRIDGEDVKVLVHRKGATRAFPPSKIKNGPFKKYGHPILVPGDMGTCSYVLVATEEAPAISLASSCHGAGRKMSRHMAMSRFDSSNVINEMRDNGIILKAKDLSSISSEAHGSYKDIDSVVNAIVGAGIAKPVAKLVPLGVVKG